MRVRIAALLMFGIAGLAFAPVPAKAQASDAIKALVGAWEISTADRDKTCMVNFKSDASPGGFKIEFNKAACAADFPPLKDVVAWNLAGDNVRLNDARGRMIFDFSEVENGMYESLKAGQPLTFLQNAAVVQAAVRTVEQMTGDWNVVRGAGRPICTLTLSQTAAGSSDYALQVKPGCDPAIMRFGPTVWQIDHGELVLKSPRGQVWRFEDANGAWQRVPQETEPLMLTRP